MDKIKQLAFLDQEGCNVEQDNTAADDNCKVLNRSPGYFNFGLVKLQNVGKYVIMSTRNNGTSISLKQCSLQQSRTENHDYRLRGYTPHCNRNCGWLRWPRADLHCVVLWRSMVEEKEGNESESITRARITRDWPTR
jgi:hypothetical protein